MTANLKPERTRQLRLKKSTNWFAAGEEFLRALGILTDGAFKPFVFICLKADRHSATYHTSTDQLAHALHKPLGAIESCLAEIEAKKVCSIVATNGREYSFRIADEFWPYCASPGHASAGQHATDYVAAVRQVFLDLGCTSGRFGTSEEAQARSLEKRGVPLDAVRDAMIMGACRKYVSWLNNGYSEPISSISYFESIIAELLRCPPSADYRAYLPYELKRLIKHWLHNGQTLTNQTNARSSDSGGYQTIGPSEIVDSQASQKPIFPADRAQG
jgi:hypothetical protein